MQFDQIPTQPVRPRPNRTRLVGIPAHEELTPAKNEQTQKYSTQGTSSAKDVADVAMQPTAMLRRVPLTPPFNDPLKIDLVSDVSNQITAHLMKLSGRMPAIRV